MSQRSNCKWLARLALTTAALPFFATSAIALGVSIQVPDDQPTIQAGIDSASPGDTVVVACGTYYESFIVMKSGVVLTSATGDPTCVTVDAEKNDRVFHAEATDSQTAIIGLTITNGSREASGGIWCLDSDMTIEKCVFLGNEVTHDGAAIGLAAGSNATITDCQFIGNRTLDAGLRSHNRGGAIYMWNQCTPTITNCLFVENAAFFGGAIWGSNGCSPVISNCDFIRNSAVEGGAVSLEGGSTIAAQNCRFIENTASEGGGVFLNGATGSIETSTFYANSAGLGAQCFAQGGTSVSISRSILAFGPMGGSVVCSGLNSVTLQCCNVFGNVGGDWILCLEGQAGIDGNLSADPVFCDPDAEDFHLQWSSPCLPANSPEGCGLIGAFGFGGCNSISVTPESWARVKAQYR